MKVSIVTISYNQAEFLERTILSVIDQDYDDFEYIVVDPGSTDGSREIIDRYRSKISKIIFEPDGGPADGLNKGFAQATGDIYGYLNADDAYLPSTLRKAAAAFERYGGTHVIYGHGYMVDSRGQVLRRFYSDRFSPWRHVHGGSIVMQQSTFIRRLAFWDVGGFNPDNPIWWDGELLVDLALAGKKMQVINDFWSIFTIHGNSISGQRGKDTARSYQLDVERKLTHARLYKKVMGSAVNRLTKLWMVVARIQKWLLKPVGTFWRALEKLGIRIDGDVIAP